MRSAPLFAGLFWPALLSTSAMAANLSDVHRMARENDAAYAAAYQAYLVGLEKLPQGRAGLLPSVALSAGITRVSPANISASYTPKTYTVSLTQPLYNPNNWAGYEQGRAQAEQARIQLRQAEQDLILRAAQAYADALKAQSALNTAEAQQQAIAEQLAQAKKSFEVGAATITDTHEAQARHDLTTAQVIEAQNTLEVKRRALEKLLQKPVPALATWSANAKAVAPGRAQEDWVKDAQDSGLGVLLAQLGEAYAQYGLDKARAGYKPQLNLAASYTDTRDYALIPYQNGQSSQIGLQASWSLFEGGRTQSLSREAAAGLQKSRFDLEEQRRTAGLTARQAYLGVIAGMARLQAMEAAVRSSELQLNSTKLGLEVGVRTRVDVLNAQQQLYGAQRDLDTARYDWILARLNLKAAIGQLTPGDLSEVDALLN